MRVQIIMLICFWVLTPEIMAQTPADPQATAKTTNLFKNLRKIAKRGFMLGHQDDQAYGVGWRRRGRPNEWLRIFHTDGHGRWHANAPKAIILNTRILYTFLAGFSEFGNQDYKKQVYAQTFAVYAFSEFFLATGNSSALELAQSIYKNIEKYSYHEKVNGYLEAFDREWRLMDDPRLSDKDANEAKTMNTHLHLLEAYTNLFQAWPDRNLGNQLENLINLFLDKFIEQNNHFRLFFDEHWNLRSEIYSYGHDIEGGWLLHKAAQVLGDTKLVENCEAAAIGLTEAALEGMDHEGGLMYKGKNSRIINTDRHWWPQAETLVGLINNFEISGDVKYLNLAKKSWEFIIHKLVDPTGEWYGIVHQDGSLDMTEDKAGPWKAPYHNGRAMLESMKRLANIQLNR